MSSDIKTHVIEATLRRIDDKVARIKQLFMDVDEKAHDACKLTDNDHSSIIAIGILKVLCQGIDLAEQAVDDAFHDFLEACNDMEVRPQTTLQSVVWECESKLRSEFHAEILWKIGMLSSLSNSDAEHQKIKRMINDFISHRIANRVKERSEEARHGRHKGRRVWPRDRWSRRRWIELGVGVGVTFIGGFLLWMFTAGRVW